jgi:predicted TPR repeat methyltransferase
LFHINNRIIKELRTAKTILMKHKFYNIRGTRYANLGQLDTAISCYEKALSIKPNYVEAHYNLGFTLQRLGQLDAAVRSYKKVVAIKPEYAEAHSNKILSVVYFFSNGQIPDAIDTLEALIKDNPNDALLFNMCGGCFASLGQLDMAVKNYEKALSIKPDYAVPQHMLNSLIGYTSKEPPKEYVKNLFDDFAERFDESLVDQLEYRLPFLIKELILKLGPTGNKFKKVIDLGCGTGLSGKGLRDISENLTGIDLSRNMVAKARKLEVYDHLIEGDIIDILSTSPEKYDLFIALDVFIYLGELTTIIKTVRDCCNKNALFIFSVESQMGDGYSLLKSARYSHSERYVLKTASDGFKLIESQAVNLRKEKDGWIVGKIFILQAS